MKKSNLGLVAGLSAMMIAGCETAGGGFGGMANQSTAMGTAIGALAGGVVGHQIDDDKGRYIGAVAGALAGAAGHQLAALRRARLRRTIRQRREQPTRPPRRHLHQGDRPSQPTSRLHPGVLISHRLQEKTRHPAGFLWAVFTPHHDAGRCPATGFCACGSAACGRGRRRGRPECPYRLRRDVSSRDRLSAPGRCPGR